MPFKRVPRLLSAVGTVGALLALMPAAAGAATCTTTLTQPFLATWGDANYYALAPGQSATPVGFETTGGWTLSGGAKFVSEPLYGGLSKGTVLDLPNDGSAVSPAMCVTSTYSSARAMIRYLSGTTGVNATAKYVSSGSLSGATTSTGILSGSGTAWTASSVLAITPPTSSGVESATFTLANSTSKSEDQVYDFYVDPKMRS